MRGFTVKAKMARSIARQKGEVVLRSDFAALGSPSQVGRALKWLVADVKIVRLGYGVYAKARPSTLSGRPAPRVTLEELTQEMLQKLGVVPRIGRAAAEYASARSKHVPVRVTFNTGKSRISRKLTVGISTVRFENDYGKRRCDDVGLRLASLEIRRPSQIAAMVCRCIDEMPYGSRFCAEDFQGLGPQEAIEETLKKLALVDAIQRLEPGVFLR